MAVSSTGISVTGNISPSGSVLFNDGFGINFGNSNAKIYGSSANGIQFNGGGSEKMRLNQGGDLLVGTTDNNVTNNSGTGEGINIGVAGIKGVIATARIDQPSIFPNRLNTHGDVIRILKDGTTVGVIGTQKTGFGTGSPASNLHVLGTSADTVSQANANLNVEGAGGNGMVVGTIASAPYSTYIQSGFVDNFSTAVYPLVLNPLGGNIGISQTNPTNNINSGSFFKPDSSGRFLTLNGAANGSFIMLESSSTTDDDQIGGVYFTATSGQGDAHKQVAGIDAIVYAHGTTSLNGADLRFFTKPAGAGQTTPALILEHNSNATFSGDVSLTGSGDKIISAISSDDDATLFLSGAGSGKDTHIVFGGDRDLFISKSSSATATSEGTPVLTLGSNSNATFAGNVYVGSATTNGGVINLIQSATNPEIRIQSGEGGASAFSIYNTATNPDAEQFFINNTLGSSHLGNKRGALKLETISGVNLTLSGDHATFAGSVTVDGGQILTPGGVNLALNPNTGLVTVGGSISATGTSITLDSAGSADYIADRANDTSGASYQYKTNGSLKWYHGLRGLSNNDFYLFNNTAGANALVITESGSNATFAGNITASSGTGHFSVVNASAYQLNGTTVMDSSRNLVNIGNIRLDGDSKNIKFNTTSFDDWQLTVDSNGFVIYNETDARYDLKISGTGVATFADDATFGGAITATGLTLNRATNSGAGMGINMTNTNTSGNSFATINIAGANGTVNTQIFSDGNNTGGFGSAGAVIRTSTNHPIFIGTNSTTAITISTGQLVTFAGNINLGDGKKARFGAGEYLQIQHNGTDSQITSIAGHLQFTNTANDKDITFATDDGSGGDTEYFRIDGGAEQNVFSKVVNFIGGAVGSPSFIFEGDDDTGLFHPAANTIAFSTFGNERMRITAGGDVKIGSSGTANLYLGNIISASSADRGMRLHTNNSDAFFDFQGVTSDSLFFRDYDGSGGIHVRHQFVISNGNIVAAGAVTQNGSPSDIKYKENIKTISNGIDKIEKLNPVEFDWNDKSDAHKIGKKEDAGFIAQEVQKVLPNLVNENVDGDLALNYEGIIPYLVQSIQDLKKEIEILKNK